MLHYLGSAHLFPVGCRPRLRKVPPQGNVRFLGVQIGEGVQSLVLATPHCRVLGGDWVRADLVAVLREDLEVRVGG